MHLTMRAFYAVMVALGCICLIATASVHKWVAVALIAAATAWFLFRLERIS